MNDISNKIYDIKSIVEIPDNSIFLFILVVFCSFVFLILLFLFINKFLKNRKNNQRKIYFRILKELDFKNSKNCAYTITKYGRLLATLPREKKLYEELVEMLEKYKYKKEVEDMDENIKAKIETFLDSLDV